MADASENTNGNKQIGGNELEKGEINNNSQVENNNKNISDPEILEAIMASLKGAEDAVVEPGSKEKSESHENCSPSDDTKFEGTTVEITKMDLGDEEVYDDVLDHFVFSDVTESSSSSKASKDKENQTKVVGKKIYQVLTKKANGRKKSGAGQIKVLIPMKRARRKSFKTTEDRESRDESLSEDEDDCDVLNGDTDYKPGNSKSKPRPRSRRLSSQKDFKENVQFDCCHCTFQSDILGELKIHKHMNHVGSEAPNYLDMAEAAVAKLEDSSGVLELNILKKVLFDNFDSIAEDKSSASQLLNQALRGGVKLGRLKAYRKVKGNDRYRVVNKEKMKLVVEKWRMCNKRVEFVDSTGKSKIRNVKKKISGTALVIAASNKAKDGSDSDIDILEESLTSTTKLRLMRKKLYKVPESKVHTVILQSQSIIPSSPPSPDSDVDDLTPMLSCPVCLFSFWYENETVEHMKKEHPDDMCVKKLETMDDESEQKLENLRNKCEKIKHPDDESVNEMGHLVDKGVKKMEHPDDENVKKLEHPNEKSVIVKKVHSDGQYVEKLEHQDGECVK